ncbi:MAG: hypothetical protein ACTSRO_04260, partial [Candidatus Heimdallarchaeaceae archaeon]
VEHEITWYLAIAPVNMTSEYGVTTLPTFVIINPYGNITFSQDGVQSYDTLKTEILKALKGASGVELTSYLGFTIGLAVIVAITSFFSPCSFPLLPGYIAHIVGVAYKEEDESEKEVQKRRKLWKNQLFYPILGLSGGLGILISYLILGIVISALGSAIKPFFIYVLPVIGGIFIVLGILMFTPIEISFNRILDFIRKKQMNLEAKKKKDTKANKIISTFLYGLGYGIASIGCNGPVFLFFSLQVSLEATIIRMIFDYLAFALTILFLMIGVTILLMFSKDVIVQKLKASTAIIKIVSGVIMVGVGIYLIIEFVLGL